MQIDTVAAACQVDTAAAKPYAMELSDACCTAQKANKGFNKMHMMFCFLADQYSISSGCAQALIQHSSTPAICHRSMCIAGLLPKPSHCWKYFKNDTTTDNHCEQVRGHILPNRYRRGQNYWQTLQAGTLPCCLLPHHKPSYTAKLTSTD